MQAIRGCVGVIGRHRSVAGVGCRIGVGLCLFLFRGKFLVLGNRFSAYKRGKTTILKKWISKIQIKFSSTVHTPKSRLITVLIIRRFVLDF